MRRSPVLIAIAFLLGLGLGFYARGAGTAEIPRGETRAADLAAIEKLHQADIDSTLKQDASLMTNLWSEDGVKLDVAGPPVAGKKAMQELYAKFQAEHPEFQVLKYSPGIQEVQIADGWAIEVGDFEGTFKMTAKDNPITIKEKGARVLRKQSDGSWKFAVVGLK
jgi:uncharacterized protein (TIGR02246 family)